MQNPPLVGRELPASLSANQRSDLGGGALGRGLAGAGAEWACLSKFPWLRTVFLVAVTKVVRCRVSRRDFCIVLASPGLGRVEGAGPGAGEAAFSFVTAQSVVEQLG